MNKIKLNEIEYEFKYSFKAIAELLKAEKITLNELSTFGQDLTKIPVIAYYGIGKVLSIEEIESILDMGEWKDVLAIIETFSNEVSQYFGGSESPNELKNSSVSDSGN